jgi:hypothetical protein
MNREEWLIMKSVVSSAIAANVMDCAEGEEVEYSTLQRTEVARGIADEVSIFQLESLKSLVDEALEISIAAGRSNLLPGCGLTKGVV